MEYEGVNENWAVSLAAFGENLTRHAAGRKESAIVRP